MKSQVSQLRLTLSIEIYKKKKHYPKCFAKDFLNYLYKLYNYLCSIPSQATTKLYLIK